MIAVAALVAPAAHAVGTARIALDAASGPGWSARGIVVALTLGTRDPRATIEVREARLPGELGTARRLRIECPRLESRGGLWRCRDARVAGLLGPLGEQRVAVDFEYHGVTGALRFDVRDVALAGGRARLAGTARDAGWQATLAASAVDLAAAARLAQPWTGLPEGWSVGGRAQLDAAAQGTGARLRAARAMLTFEAVDVANAEGSIASDDLAGRVEANLAPAGRDWRFAARVALPGGQGYADPVFVDFGKLPLELEAAGILEPDAARLRVERFAARQRGAFAATGTAELGLPTNDAVAGTAPRIRRAEIALESVDFPGAGAYVAPLLTDTPLRNGTARGRLRGQVLLVADSPASLDVTLDGLDLDDPGGALAFTRLQGRVRWYDDATRSLVAQDDAAPDDAFVSTLAWDAGRLYGMQLGPADLRFTTSGRGFRLLAPTVIPVLDGGLAIDTLRLRHVGTPKMWLRLDARVQPISIALITRALGWPEFGGTIAGTIPRAALENGVLTFGGNLEADVFGGRVVASDLRLEDPLGRFPRLYTTLGVTNLDLQAVTGTFEFGEITGRLSGRVADLELFDWQPVRFDASFATPEGDRSRRRISQRAVQNLSSIGGGGFGVAAALQGGVMRFFETFRYDRLGLSCRLERDVCRMSGVGPAPNGGYYIVRGSGLPRIDIIGNGDRVAWTRLVQQLQAATESGGVEVR
ncbi:MAG: hypothetical protein O9284_08030 [Steroidobacteraceae bacterium]|jgi:hypothetical protein|nr:hypothetical protein [Steroidobacteraceae bacterium]